MDKSQLTPAEEQTAINIENEYNTYWKLPKARVIEIYKSQSRVELAIKESEVTKDEIITEILTARHGNRRMNAWRAYIG